MTKVIQQLICPCSATW